MGAEGFNISLSRYLTSEFVYCTRWLWKGLGRLETKTLGRKVEAQSVEAPVYIAGMARSGSTILLKVIASHPDVATHQYRDFPFVYVPYWWRQTLENRSDRQLEPAERAHQDRIEVTPESPEAREEVLWMAFFDGLHDPSVSNVLDDGVENEAFEVFYRNHIRKLLLNRVASRYAAKGNYNLTRFKYLAKLFPDARFVVPVRHPERHIASSRKQHRLFCEAGREHPRSMTYLKRVGHFEFGPHRAPINAADPDEVESIIELWENGDEVRGWARYWAHLYGFLDAQLERDDQLASQVTVVRYEDLCDETEATLRQVLSFADLADGADTIVERFCERISRPDYYEAEFTDDERRAVWDEVADVAPKFGYEQ